MMIWKSLDQSLKGIEMRMATNDERRENLIAWLLDNAWDKKYGLELVSLDPWFESCAVEEDKLIILNINWHNKNEIPFILAHEISHLDNKDSGILYYSGFNSKIEFNANTAAIKLLLDYSIAQMDGFTDPQKFIEAYCIPSKYLYVAEYFFETNRDLFY